MVEWQLPIPQIRGSNPSYGIFLLSSVVKLFQKNEHRIQATFVASEQQAAECRMIQYNSYVLPDVTVTLCNFNVVLPEPGCWRQLCFSPGCPSGASGLAAFFRILWATTKSTIGLRCAEKALLDVCSYSLESGFPDSLHTYSLSQPSLLAYLGFSD